MIFGLNLFPLNAIMAQSSFSIALQTLSGSASRNTLQYTLPTDEHPDPALTNCMACAVQIGMCCANWYSTCPAYLNQINNVTQLQCTWSLLI